MMVAWPLLECNFAAIAPVSAGVTMFFPGDKVFFAASGASDAAYRPLDVNLKSVLPPRFSLQYGTLAATGRPR